MIKSLKHFLTGYLTIELRGKNFVSLINLLSQQNYEIWSVKVESDKLYFKVSKHKFSVVKKLCLARGYEVLVIGQEGIYFYLKKLQQRKGLIFGFFLVVFLLHFSACFLFTIRIIGTKELEKGAIKASLKELNVKPGRLKASINQSEIEKKLLEKHPSLTWANLSYQGTELQVKVVEKNQVEYEEKANEIIAEIEGVITEIIVLKGSSLVEVGDVVQKGDVLIINQIIYEAEGKKQAEPIDEAKGIVRARTWYEGYGEARLENFYYQTTAESTTDIIIKINNKEYLLQGSNTPPYSNFKVSESTKSLAKWRNINFPLEIITRRYNKIVAYQEKKDIATAKQVAKNRAKKSILQDLSKKAIILDSNFKLLNSDDEVIRVKALFEVKGNIGKRKGQ